MLLEEPDLSFSAAIFESFSGLTTTGATVIEGLDKLPKSLLFYRQFLQWLGGMGIIVLAVAIIPLLGIGGSQLYRAESSGPLKEQKLKPRIAEVAKLLWILYLSLTVACTLAYWFAGMNWFDAIGHSFSTVSNGGFSSYDANLGYFNNSAIYIIATVFMLIAGINFNLHISAFTYFGKNNIAKQYWRDPEFRFFVIVQFIFILLFSLSLYFYHSLNNLTDAFVQGSLQMVSMSMTSGFTIFDLNKLPAISAALLIIASLIGGCGGSTTGGLKAVRALILLKQAKSELRLLVHPNLIQPIKLGRHILSGRMLGSIWAFLIVSLLVYWLCVLAVILCGMGVFDAMGAVFATLTNAGPGLGVVHQDFFNVPDNAKIIFSFAMLCGRLEIFSLLVIFTPTFWRT